MSILCIYPRQPDALAIPSPSRAAGFSLAIAAARREFAALPSTSVSIFKRAGRRWMAQASVALDTRRAYRPLIYRTPTRI
jgi:hypothetical protein